jgi:hypothetical protein
MLTYERIRKMSREFVEEFNKEFCKSDVCTIGFNYVEDPGYYGIYLAENQHIVISVKSILRDKFTESNLIGLLAHEVGHHIEGVLICDYAFKRKYFSHKSSEYFANNFSFLYRHKESKDLAWKLGDAPSLWRYNKDLSEEPNFWYKNWKKNHRKNTDVIILEKDGHTFIDVEHPIIHALMDGIECVAKKTKSGLGLF